MKRIRDSIPILLLIGVMCTYWLFNFGPLQPISKPLEECGLWAHNLYNEFLPDYDYAFRRVKTGELPLWNPFQACGVPSLADIQIGVFYPLNMLFVVLPSETAIGFTILLHLGIAAVFTYLFFLRVFPSVSTLAAFLCAIAFVFNPRMYELTLFPGSLMAACWLPPVMYFGKQMADKPTRRNCALLASSVALTFLSGFVQIAVYICLFLIVFLSYEILRKARGEHEMRQAGMLMVYCIVAALTAALLVGPQLLPTYELITRSGRTPGTMTAEMSQVYGPDAYSFSAWLSGILAYPRDFKLVDGWHPIPPWSLFLTLACLNIFSRKHWSQCGFFGIAGIVFFLLSLGTNTPLYRMYWNYFPTGDWFTTPIRLRLISYFCFALLAANGADVLARLQDSVAPARAGLIYRIGLVGIVSTLMLGALIVLPSGFSVLSCCIVVAHFILLMGITILTGKCRKDLRRISLALLLCIAIIESLIWYANKVPFPARIDPRKNLYSAATAEWLGSINGGWRVHIENGWGLTFFGLPTVPEKFGSLFEIPVTTNWEPLTVQSYQEFCNHLTGRRWYYGRFQLAGRPFSEKMFDMLAARYIVFSDAGADWIGPRLRTERGRERYRLIQDLGAQKIYENTHALARVNFASRWETMRDSAELYRRMQDESFDHKATVLLLEPLPGPMHTEDVPLASQHIKAYNIDYEAVHIELDAPCAGVVWISDCFYPGWKVFVGGVEGKLLRVNGAFRGVYVAGGRHDIRMVFHPPSFRVGLLLGGIGLLLLFCMTVRVERLIARLLRPSRQ